MTWSAPSARAFSILSFEPTVVMTVQPIFLASWIAAEPMPEPPAWTRIVSPGSSLALSNSMCSTVPKVTGAHGGGDVADAGRGRNEQAGRQVDLLLREAVEMEAVHAGDVLAQIVAAFAAGLAEAAGARAVDR